MEARCFNASRAFTFNFQWEMLGKLERREVNDKDEGEEFMMQTSEEREKLFRKRSNWCAIQGWEGRES
jgi:hypothetical protein